MSHINLDISESDGEDGDFVSAPTSPAPSTLSRKTSKMHRSASSWGEEELRWTRYIAGLTEVVEGEELFLQDLELLDDVYFKELERESTVGKTELEKVRRNVSLLRTFQEKLCVNLEGVRQRLRQQCDALGDLAKIYIDLESDFAVFEDYVARHAEATKTLRNLESRMDFDAYDRRCASLIAAISSSPTSLRLEDYAIKPIQKICRYTLIFEQISKNAPITSKPLLLNLIIVMKRIGDRVQERKRIRELELKTKIIGERAKWPEDVMEPNMDAWGQLRLVGTLFMGYIGEGKEKPETKYYGIGLWREQCLIWKVRNRTFRPFEPKFWFPLGGWVVVDTGDEGITSYNFRLSSDYHTFEFGATSEAEKELWLFNFRAAIKISQASIHSTDLFTNLNLPTQSPFLPPPSIFAFSGHASSSCDSSPQFPSTEIPSVDIRPLGLAPRNRLSQTASSFMGKNSSNTRLIVDLKMADVFSDELAFAHVSPTTNSATLPQRSSHRKRPSSIGPIFYFGQGGGRRSSLVDKITGDHDCLTDLAPNIAQKGRLSEPPSPMLRPVSGSNPDLYTMNVQSRRHRVTRSLSMRRGGSSPSLDVWNFRRKRTISSPTNADPSSLKNLVVQPNPRKQSVGAMSMLLLPSPILEANSLTLRTYGNDDIATSSSSSSHGCLSSEPSTQPTPSIHHEPLCPSPKPPLLQRARTLGLSKFPSTEGSFLNRRFSKNSLSAALQSSQADELKSKSKSAPKTTAIRIGRNKSNHSITVNHLADGGNEQIMESLPAVQPKKTSRIVQLKRMTPFRHSSV